jgi:hypothetical protein
MVQHLLEFSVQATAKNVQDQAQSIAQDLW